MSYKQTDKPIFERIETSLPIAPEYNDDRLPTIIDPAEWEHVCPARFGEARVSSFSKTIHWTGDSYRYDIFQRTDAMGCRHVALRWWNGAGQGWLVTKDNSRSGETNLLDHIVGVADEARRWDYCHFLWQAAYKSGLYAGRQIEKKMKLAFVEGRLKKRKASGTAEWKVTVESKR